MKHLKLFEEFETDSPELINSIKEYLLNEYPSSWWENEFSNRVNDYVDEDDYVGDGDIDDPDSWEYEGPEEAYQNLCSGGAIEYDIIEEIREDIIKNFHITNEEYFEKGIDDIVEEHMCNMIDWYDHGIFGESKGKGFFNHLDTSHWDNLPTEINGIKL